MPLEHGKTLGEIGSVSRATHRTGDLIESFSFALRELWPSKATELETSPTYAPVFAYLESDAYDNDAWFVDATEELWDAANFLLDELVNCLQACAPNRAYFGAHPGGGSEFGFWYDCEDCDYWEDCPYCQGQSEDCPHKDD